MDEISVRAITIGVAIFVTMVITSIVIFEFTHIREIYKSVGETNVSFESRLEELNKYKDKVNEFNGLDVKNTIEKYRMNPSIEVCINNNCTDAYIEKTQYSIKYKSELIPTQKGYKINFVAE